MNQASEWRMTLARHLAGRYERESGLEGALVASSTARGHADRFSDLDLVLFWRETPSEAMRRGVIDGFGADLAGLYTYDPLWHCWSDMFNMGRDSGGDPHTGLAIDVTHYLLDEARDMTRAVVEDFATDEQRHNLVALLAYGMPLSGEHTLLPWQETLTYSEELATVMVSRYGQIDYFWRWESALARGENLMLVQENFARFAQQLLRTLLALNRSYFFGFGWIDEVLARCVVAPAGFPTRYRMLWKREPESLANELAALIEETYDLVEKQLPSVDVDRLRRIFRYRRTFWDQPPPLLAQRLAELDDVTGAA